MRLSIRVRCPCSSVSSAEHENDFHDEEIQANLEKVLIENKNQVDWDEPSTPDLGKTRLDDSASSIIIHSLLIKLPICTLLRLELKRYTPRCLVFSTHTNLSASFK